MTMEELKVIIDAETKPFRDELNKMQVQMKNTTNTVVSQTSKIKSALATVGKAIAGLAIGRALINIGKTAISTASQIQEVQNVVDTAFGDMSWKAERFAASALESFGLSELSAKRTASTYIAMASGMSLSQDAASDMAITLAGLTGDVASFYNISQELADIKLKSVFTGETETLKDLGIVMTQANLQAYALSQGINMNISDMTQAQLTTLRYNYVLQQLALAQGDFTRTSGSWANQVRILQEQFKQLLSIIGNGLITVLTPVIQVLNTIISKVITFANVLAAVFGKIFGKKESTNQNAFSGVSNAIDSGTDAIGGYTGALDDAGKQAQKTAKEIEGSLAGFDELNVIKTNSNSDTGCGSSGGGAGGGGAGGFDIDPIDWDSAFPEPDTSGIDAAVEKVMGYYNKLRDFLNAYGPATLGIVASIVAGLGTLWLMYNWPSIFAGITGPLASLVSGFNILKQCIANLGLVETIAGFMGIHTSMLPIIALVSMLAGGLVYLYTTSEQFRNLVNSAISSIIEILSNLWNTVLKPLATFLLDFFNTILTPLVAFLATMVVTNIDVVMTILLALWNNVLAPIADFIVEVLAIAVEGIIEVWGKWKPKIEALYDALFKIWDIAFKPIAEWVKNTFIKVFEDFGKAIEELIPSIKEMFQGLVDFFVGVFTLDIDRAWEGVQKIFEGFLDFLSKILGPNWEKHFSFLSNVIDVVYDTIKNNFDSIKQIFSGIIDFVAGVFTGDWSRAWQGVVDIFSGIFSSIAGIVKAPINAVIGIINGAISHINGFGFDVPDWVPGIGGSSFRVNVPTIPYLANGGIVDSATLAMIGERGQEAVIPLKNNTQGLALIANKLLENMPVNNNTGTYVIQLVLEDGTVLAKKIIKNIKDYEVMTGKPAF